MTDVVAVPAAEKSTRRRSLIAGCSAHAVHDGLTDVIYVLLPIWQAQLHCPTRRSDFYAAPIPG